MIPSIVPAFRAVRVLPGWMNLPAETRVFAVEERLAGLVEVLDGEFSRLMGIGCKLSRTVEQAEIVLETDTRLADEEYRLEIEDQAVVTGGSPGAVAMGTVSLLQLLAKKNGRPALPRLSARDRPHSPYRGLMLDLARTWHDFEILKQAVVLCRWYKINHLHLHLTDSESFTFPCKAFPRIVTKGRHYTLAQLRRLESFATARGVTLVPELDVPGHSGAMISAMPELFGIQHWKKSPLVLNMGREKVYRALDIIIGEMTAVFRASPYFHIGCDEVSMDFHEEDPDVRRTIARCKLRCVHELYRHFLCRMNEIVKKHDKQTLVWEGFGRFGQVQIPRDIIVFEFETLFNLPGQLLKDGYRLVNTSWQPLYVAPRGKWDPEYIYRWNLSRWENWWEKAPSHDPIQLKPTPRIIGAEMCSWANPGTEEIPLLRRRLPAMAERIWVPDRRGSVADFLKRLKATDRRLDRLL